jgi:hypothetical protein
MKIFHVALGVADVKLLCRARCEGIIQERMMANQQAAKI